MKSRLFVGSSVENLSLAYAVQTNLKHDVEVTVWNQGVFNLSASALESLTGEVHASDFAVFIFAADDITKIRGENVATVRDNIVFELGLFMGVLGKNRCFFLVPEGNKELQIPSDLVGVTPGTYETGRTDNNVAAATGPACNQVRVAAQKLGTRADRASLLDAEAGTGVAQGADETDPEKADVDRYAWLEAYFDRDYVRSTELLAVALNALDAEEDSEQRYFSRPMLEAFAARVEWQLHPDEGVRRFSELVVKHADHAVTREMFASAYNEADQPEAAIAVVEAALADGVLTSGVLKMKVQALKVLSREEEIESFLQGVIAAEPNVAPGYRELAAHHSAEGDHRKAARVLADANQRMPSDAGLLAEYANELAQLPDKKMALAAYDRVTRLQPKSVSGWGLSANVKIELDLNDLAWAAYKKADELAEGKEAWIQQNLGNLLKNRGLFSEGIAYLRKGLELDPESEYAHERLARAIALRDEEAARYEGLLAEGREEIVALRRAPEEGDGS